MLKKVLNAISVKFQKEGIHCYPGVVEREELKDQHYLQYPHRHMFFFEVMIEVTHNDRDIEFLNFKNWLQSLYQGTLQLDFKSCEMISDELAEKIHERYPGRNITITVKEDNENGSVAVYTPEDNT